MVKQFKNDFLWGASSSAFQIEGAWNEDGKGLTVADYNSFKKSAVQADTKVASDFYHHFKEDIALMKELGLKPIVFLFHGHESFQQVMAKSIKPASIFIMPSLIHF